jgi:hypothetical protein
MRLARDLPGVTEDIYFSRNRRRYTRLPSKAIHDRIRLVSPEALP